MGVSQTKSNNSDLLLFQITSEMLPEKPVDIMEISQCKNLVLTDSSVHPSAFEPEFGILNIDQNQLSDSFLARISDEPSDSFNMLMDEEVSSTLDLGLTQGVRVL